jgi:hypothetical protein
MTQANNVGILTPKINASGQLDATTGLTGATPVANGGTGAATLTANNVLLGNGTSAVTFVAPSTNGNVLTSNGSTWTSAAAGGGFPAGTRMSFQQTSSPTGWTKDTTAAINDSMIRLVTGSASSGGTTAFSTWSAVTATGATTLDTTQIPSHSHELSISNGVAEGGSPALDRPLSGSTFIINTGSTGGGGSHTHSLTRNLKYYDFIIAAKD